jgi:hypothetical protein
MPPPEIYTASIYIDGPSRLRRLRPRGRNAAEADATTAADAVHQRHVVAAA